MTLPPDPPALVLGIPGVPDAASEELTAGIVDEIAELAASSRQRLQVRCAYSGAREDVASAVADIGESDHAEAPDAILVPLLANPHPDVQTALQQEVSAVDKTVAVAEPLAPHPLVAGILQQRLADSGLARSDRPRLLSVSTSADGIIIAAHGGTHAIHAADATSVLLASRLTVPAAPAALDGSPDIGSAAVQLRDAGASRLAVAPLIVGPEVESGHLAEAAASVGANHCAPLGAHPDVAKLVMLSYGAALDEAIARAEHDRPRQ